MFDKTLYTKTFAATLGLAVFGLFLSYLYFGSVTVTDTIGSVICAAIVAFMAQLFIIMRRNENS
jgi:exosortase/archaeosortase